MTHEDMLEAVREALGKDRYDEALETAQAVVDTHPDPVRLREAHRLALQAAFFLGEREAARRHGIAALSLAYEEGGPLNRARAHNDLAVLLGSQGLFELALDHLWQAVHATEEAGAEVEGGPLNNLGNVHLELERHDEAVAFFERAVERFGREGNEVGAAIARANVGRAHALAGRGAQAIEALDEALETFERLGRQDDVVATHAKLGRAHAVAGAPYHARRSYGRALDLHGKGHATRLLPETRRAYGVFALEQGEIELALEHLQAAADAHEDEDALARAGVLEPLSRALEAAGRIPEALATLRRQMAWDDEHKRATAYAAARIRLLELELGTGGDQEIARLRSVELERANDVLLRETQRLEELSTTDSLTGLRNRRALERRIAEEVAEARRHGRPLVLALVDLDRFKQVNDDFSHETGDRVLRRVAELLSSNVRASDLAARWGGEEFALLLPNTDLQNARILLDRVCAAVADHPWDRLDARLRVTASIGAAGLEEVADVSHLLRLADRRLYAAKADGRDRTVIVG